MINQVAQHGNIIMNNSNFETFWHSSWSSIKVILWAVVIAFSIRTVFYEPFRIPSESMEPGLVTGDFILVSKYSYGYGMFSAPFKLPFLQDRLFEKLPDRGDVAVFRPEQIEDDAYIKRIIGLPNDTVQIREGVLYINAKPVPRKYLAEQKWQEVLPNDRRIVVQEVDDNFGRLDDTKVYRIPDGYVFGLGDNRDRSRDSRVIVADADGPPVGLIPISHLIGRAELIVFSLHDWDLDEERFFLKIR